MSRERSRWRELAYLFVRIPVGIATFAITVVALAVPLALVWAPIHARQVDDFGDWSGSSELHDVASNSWAWGLVPLGLGLLIVSMHLLNTLAGRCGRWGCDRMASVISETGELHALHRCHGRGLISGIGHDALTVLGAR